MSRAFRFAMVGFFTLPILSACGHFHHKDEPEPEPRVIKQVEPIKMDDKYKKYR